MLRRKGTQDQHIARAVEPASSDVPIISSESPKNTFRSRIHLGKKGLLGVALILVVIAVAVFFVVANQPQKSTDNGTSANDPRAGVNTSTDPEDLKSPLEKQKENPPAANASAGEQATYYSGLAQQQADRGDYTAAIASFTKGEQVAAAAMTYQDYYVWAYYYEQSGNKPAAIEKLQKVLTILPDQDKQNTGYNKAELTAQINTRIQELSQ